MGYGKGGLSSSMGEGKGKVSFREKGVRKGEVDAVLLKAERSSYSLGGGETSENRGERFFGWRWRERLSSQGKDLKNKEKGCALKKPHRLKKRRCSFPMTAAEGGRLTLSEGGTGSLLRAL